MRRDRDEDDDDFEEDYSMGPTDSQRDKATELAKTTDDAQLAGVIRARIEDLNIVLLAASVRKLDVDIGTGRWKKAHRVGEPTPRTIRVGKITKEL